MKRFKTIIACLILLSASGCNIAGNCIEGSGHQVSETRTVEAFGNVEVTGSIKVVLKQGDGYSARVVSDDNLQDVIITRVTNGTLDLRTDQDVCESGPIVVYVTAPDFKGIKCSGSTEIANEGTLSLDHFLVDCSGAVEATLDIEAEHLTVTCSGAAEFKLEGASGELSIHTSGASSVSAMDMSVKTCRLETSGSSDIKVQVSEELVIEASGASDIRYKGNPRVSSNVSGASSVKKID